MAAGLRALGVEVDRRAGRVLAGPPGPLRGPAQVDGGLAGTVMRFLPPVAALADGDGHLRRRPARAQPAAGPDPGRAARRWASDVDGRPRCRSRCTAPAGVPAAR